LRLKHQIDELIDLGDFHALGDSADGALAQRKGIGKHGNTILRQRSINFAVERSMARVQHAVLYEKQCRAVVACADAVDKLQELFAARRVVRVARRDK
jgi:hypothetical protein